MNKKKTSEAARVLRAIKSERRSAAARVNGLRGGRPKGTTKPLSAIRCTCGAQTEAAHKSHCPRGQAVRRRQKAGAEKADTKLAQKLAALDALVMATADAPADDSRESLYAERGL